MAYGFVLVITKILGIPAALVLILLTVTCSGSDATGPGGGGPGGGSFAGQIDHNCVDLNEIPAQWIDSVQSDIRMHYAHTSHGGQLTTGLALIESDDSSYDVEIGSSYLPDIAGALCIFDGQEGDTYITPELFWESADGMNMTRDVLTNNPTINVCMWCWCCQLDYYGEGQVQAYIDSMSVLEDEFSGVTFVYITGNAQNTGSEGYNRYLRNEQIRQFCENNNKMLYDFADLDAWWYNSSSSQWEQNTYSWSGGDIPVEHVQFNGDEAGHTTYESCRQKGRAVWWMLAMIDGWEGS
ncbi:MAG: hypothetical protein KAT09_06700 [Candidatus Aegiribacteria sp.]|nr:hypothetical protein [Candidatus Aegiribacteria sp.]